MSVDRLPSRTWSERGCGPVRDGGEAPALPAANSMPATRMSSCPASSSRSLIPLWVFSDPVPRPSTRGGPSARSSPAQTHRSGSRDARTRPLRFTLLHEAAEPDVVQWRNAWQTAKSYPDPSAGMCPRAARVRCRSVQAQPDLIAPGDDAGPRDSQLLADCGSCLEPSFAIDRASPIPAITCMVVG